MIIVSPSLLAADFLNLRESINSVSRAPWLHYDVMDGCFVPNISMGYDILKQIDTATSQFLDVHLMLSNPSAYIEQFAGSGADLITFHYEAVENPCELINKIQALGVKVGISIKPATPAEEIFNLLDKIDLALVMSVEPGFGGQSFMTSAVEKILKLRKEAGTLPLHIEVDGGINEETARLCVNAGCDVLVAGSAVFNSENPNEYISMLSLL